MLNVNRKLDYGVDAPGIVRNCLVFGGLGICAGILLARRGRRMSVALGAATAIGSAVPFALGVLMLHYSKAGKFRSRDQILDSIKWNGQEAVLDIGTGRGLLLIGAAKRTDGRVVGIDLWKQEDLSQNRLENTLTNAEIEGVKDRIEIRNQDAQRMDLPDCTFDVVISNLCLHNIPTPEGRDRACREIVRVVKPGGMAVISDYTAIEEYRRAFEAAGCHVEPAQRIHFFPPLKVVRARKPSA
jgi:SAM-dependent methyltransferase